MQKKKNLDFSILIPVNFEIIKFKSNRSHTLI